MSEEHVITLSITKMDCCMSRAGPAREMLALLYAQKGFQRYFSPFQIIYSSCFDHFNVD